jgi:hypothetical protein
MRNIRMIELSEYLTLQLQSRMHPDREGPAVYDFDRNLLLELGIGALRQVNLPHTAGTQRAQYPIRSYAVSHHFWSMHPDPYPLQTTWAPCGRVLLECMKAGPYSET